MSNWKLEALVIERSDATGNAYAVAVAIAALGDRTDEDWATASLDRIAIVARCNRRSVPRAVEQLRNIGELEVDSGAWAERGKAARITRYRIRRDVLESRLNRVTTQLSALTSTRDSTPPVTGDLTPLVSGDHMPPVSSDRESPHAAKRTGDLVSADRGPEVNGTGDRVPPLLTDTDTETLRDSPHARTHAREARGDGSVDVYAEACRAAGLGTPTGAELDLVLRKARNLLAGDAELEDVLEACRRAARGNEARFLDRLCGDAKRDRLGVHAPASRRAQQQARLFAEAKRT